MSQDLHSQARTTHLIRKETRKSTWFQATLAMLYNVSRLTVSKWQNHDSVEDKSHRSDTMHTMLSEAQEC